MPRQPLPSAPRPVAWALLSQSLWLPLLAIDLHDRWQARLQTQAPRPGDVGLLPDAPGSRSPSLAPFTPGLAGRSSGAGAGILLGSGPTGARPTAISRPASLQGSAGSRFVVATEEAGSLPSGLGNPSPASPAAGLLKGTFTRAEQLGGPITLADLQAVSMPPLALAEQGRRSLSGDPMAALPEAWREPMRQALKTLPAPGGTPTQIETARHIHVPSRRISAPTEVPLALQADGSVDILSQPKEAAVVEVVRDWSARQPLPAEGHVAPAVLHLHPIEETQTLRPPVLNRNEPPAAPASP